MLCVFFALASLMVKKYYHPTRGASPAIQALSLGRLCNGSLDGIGFDIGYILGTIRRHSLTFSTLNLYKSVANIDFVTYTVILQSREILERWN